MSGGGGDGYVIVVWEGRGSAGSGSGGVGVLIRLNTNSWALAKVFSALENGARDFSRLLLCPAPGLATSVFRFFGLRTAKGTH